MNIVVSGSHGLVGSALLPVLASEGHHVIRLSRPNDNPTEGMALEGIDAVIHLAGESIAEGRWTEKKKERIRLSRVQGTRWLAEALTTLNNPPKVFIVASAIGYYGNRGWEILTEESAPGFGFLPEVCQAWETAAEPAKKCGIRVVHARFGIVLSPEGGALPKMLLPVKLGAGGPLGSGQQWMSWVDLQDVIGALSHALHTESLEGPVNVVSPNPLRNEAFIHTLGKVVGRPTLIPTPGFALRLLLGKMADALLLSSTRVLPEKLLQSGYTFQYPDSERSLRHLLG